MQKYRQSALIFTRLFTVSSALTLCLTTALVSCKTARSISEDKGVTDGSLKSSSVFTNSDLSSTEDDDIIDPKNFPNIPLHGDIDKAAYGSIIGSGNLKRKSSLEESLIAANEGRSTPRSSAESYALAGSKQTHGPAFAVGDNCPGLIDSIAIVNKAMNAGGKCNAWFDKHGPVSGPFKVIKSSYKLACLSQAPTWTYPYVNRIGFCAWACEKGTTEVTSLLIHEIGHHYCPSFIGRETCAISAQEACGDELSNPIRK